jgi:TonB dependent receptor
LSSGPGFIPLGGAQLPFSSRVTAGLGFSYTQPVGGNWALVANGNAQYRSKFYNFSEPNTDRVQGAHTLLTLRAGVQNDRWEFSLWCRNCTDERIANSNFQLPFDGTVLGHGTRWSHVAEPRIIGLSASYAFN